MSNTTDYSKLPPAPPTGSVAWASLFGVPPPAEQVPSMTIYRPQALIQPFNMVERMKVANKHPIIGAVMGLANPDMAKYGKLTFLFL